MGETQSAAGPFYLRWTPGEGGRAGEESFATLDEALDAVEARWEQLQHQAPRVFDRRKVLLASTEDLGRMMAEEPGGTERQ